MAFYLLDKQARVIILRIKKCIFTVFIDICVTLDSIQVKHNRST